MSRFSVVRNVVKNIARNVVRNGAGFALVLLFASPLGPVVAEEINPPLDVETILNTPSEKTEYVDEHRCIQSRLIRKIEVLDDRHVVFQLARDRYFLVQFDHRCPAMRPTSTIAYESNGSRVCALDRIRPLNGWGGGIPCQIPGFQEINEDQMSLLRDTLSGRRNPERPAVESPPSVEVESG